MENIKDFSPLAGGLILLAVPAGTTPESLPSTVTGFLLN
jgi:hypothetical protein